MKTSPTSRSLKYLREQGWTACIVEKWIPPRGTMKFGVRVDAFGFGDILACGPNQVALVQSTTTKNMAARREKIRGIPEARKWQDAGGTILLHGWKLSPKDGVHGARKVWTLIEEVL